MYSVFHSHRAPLPPPPSPSGFPQIPSETCAKLIEKWVHFKVTEFKGFWRSLPDSATDGFIMRENRNFAILFSVLPGLLQHPSQKVESASSNLAEQVIVHLKTICTKYCSIMLGWPKEHPQYLPLSQFITAAFLSFSRASYFYAVPLKNCIEATAANVNVFHPTLEYTVRSQLFIGELSLTPTSANEIRLANAEGS